MGIESVEIMTHDNEGKTEVVWVLYPPSLNPPPERLWEEGQVEIRAKDHSDYFFQVCTLPVRYN